MVQHLVTNILAFGDQLLHVSQTGALKVLLVSWLVMPSHMLRRHLLQVGSQEHPSAFLVSSGQTLAKRGCGKSTAVAHCRIELPQRGHINGSCNKVRTHQYQYPSIVQLRRQVVELLFIQYTDVCGLRG